MVRADTPSAICGAPSDLPGGIVTRPDLERLADVAARGYRRGLTLLAAVDDAPAKLPAVVARLPVDDLLDWDLVDVSALRSLPVLVGLRCRRHGGRRGEVRGHVRAPLLECLAERDLHHIDEGTALAIRVGEEDRPELLVGDSPGGRRVIGVARLGYREVVTEARGDEVVDDLPEIVDVRRRSDAGGKA